MIIVPRVRAQTFHRFLSSGRTRPSLFSCDEANGASQQYVVKSYQQLRSGAIKELIAALLGRQLGLPTPPVAVVELDQRLTQFSPDLQGIFGKMTGIHFGSIMQVGGYVPFAQSYSALVSGQLPPAFAIFAWDMLIQNPDRRRDNPNLLTNGEEFVLIDHELALGFDLLIGEPPPPWHLRGTPWAQNHIFYSALRSKVVPTSFDSFLERFAALSPVQFEEIVHATPPEWQGDILKQRIVDHFVLVHTHLDKFRQGLLEVML